MRQFSDMVQESADKSLRAIFGLPIKYNQGLLPKLIKLGMDFRHEYDEFKVYEDGTIEYTNSQFFSGPLKARVQKTQLNRIAKPDMWIRFDKAPDPMTGDMSAMPTNLFRAVLNALTLHTYECDTYEVKLTGLNYTQGDFTKDKKL